MLTIFVNHGKCKKWFNAPHPPLLVFQQNSEAKNTPSFTIPLCHPFVSKSISNHFACFCLRFLHLSRKRSISLCKSQNSSNFNFPPFISFCCWLGRLSSPMHHSYIVLHNVTMMPLAFRLLIDDCNWYNLSLLISGFWLYDSHCSEG